MEVVEFLRNPDKFNRLGGKLPKGIVCFHSVRPKHSVQQFCSPCADSRVVTCTLLCARTGILMVGPPGTGMHRCLLVWYAVSTRPLTLRLLL